MAAKFTTRNPKAADGPSWTPTEQRMREASLRQFMKLDGPKGTTDAYRASDIWCDCPFGGLKVEGEDKCVRCLKP